MAEQVFQPLSVLNDTRLRGCNRLGHVRTLSWFGRSSFLATLLIALAPAWIVLGPSALHAATINVDTLDDPGTSSECSLRAAINNANNKSADANSTCAAGSGTDTIVFSVSGTITLGSGGTLPAIVNTLTINGSGQKITVDAADLYQVLMMYGSTLDLTNLTIAHGNSSSTGAVC